MKRKDYYLNWVLIYLNKGFKGGRKTPSIRRWIAPFVKLIYFIFKYSIDGSHLRSKRH